MIMDIIKDIMPRSGVCSFSDVSSSLLPCRAIDRLPKGAKSVIVGVFPYLLSADSYEGLNVSKYAAVRDYHDVVLSRLNKACEALESKYPGEKFIPFVDNSPVPEVYAAYLAGLGVIGKNGLIITPNFGSYVFIGEIVTTLPLKADSPVMGGCLDCGKCSEACQGGALKGGFVREKCLSDITQKKKPLTSFEKQLISCSGSAWGCDSCQDACPMNENAGVTDIEEFINSARPHITKGDCAEGRAYAWRGAEIIERNLDLLEEFKNGKGQQ